MIEMHWIWLSHSFAFAASGRFPIETDHALYQQWSGSGRVGKDDGGPEQHDEWCCGRKQGQGQDVSWRNAAEGG